MPSTTSRGFRYPLIDRSETADVPRDIKNLADDVNGQFISVASAGALPAFGSVGRRALITTTNQVYLDIGTAWVKERNGSSATAWENLIQSQFSWPASNGSTARWADGLGGAGSAPAGAWTASNPVPSIFTYDNTDAPPGMVAEYRIAIAFLANGQPNFTALQIGICKFPGVHAVASGFMTSSGASSLTVPAIPSYSMSTGPLTYGNSGSRSSYETAASTILDISVVNKDQFAFVLTPGSSPAAGSFFVAQCKLQRRWT